MGLDVGRLGKIHNQMIILDYMDDYL